MAAPSRIKVLIGILGLDQHEAGAYAASTLLRDAGMEVVYLGCFQLPRTIVKAAMEEDADVIGLSTHSWEYLDYMDELLELLRQENAHIPVILGGSIITPADGDLMLRKGVAAVLDSRSTPQAIVETVQRVAAGPPV